MNKSVTVTPWSASQSGAPMALNLPTMKSCVSFTGKRFGLEK